MIASNTATILTMENDANDRGKSDSDAISVASVYPSVASASAGVSQSSPKCSTIVPPIPPSKEKKPTSDETLNIYDTGLEDRSYGVVNYMVWSQINVFFGVIILGIVAILMSKYTTKLAKDGKLKKAKILSKITLGFNIFITILFTGALVFLLAYFTEIR
ncbi:unnamed protein product [Adineta ricciae]|uniref:Uncharacterized protein n=1 Tax=Adineta ricciae TaxID=249248 RepID=A0A814C9V3_ADIRI|nr:unnamed protein product [Adineta ricciae]CAF1146896.1 unnamed protein product [Adineta ricciae]